MESNDKLCLIKEDISRMSFSELVVLFTISKKESYPELYKSFSKNIKSKFIRTRLMNIVYRVKDKIMKDEKVLMVHLENTLLIDHLGPKLGKANKQAILNLESYRATGYKILLCSHMIHPQCLQTYEKTEKQMMTIIARWLKKHKVPYDEIVPVPFSNTIIGL